jgi:hypothetical protein
VILANVGYAHELFDACACRPRSTDDNLIEDGSPDSETIVAKWAKPVIRREFAVGAMAVRRADPHPGQVGRERSLDLVENIHVGQNPRPLRAQVLGARLVAGKFCSVQHEDVNAFPRQCVSS